jgi:hypothetical protein
VVNYKICSNKINITCHKKSFLQDRVIPYTFASNMRELTSFCILHTGMSNKIHKIKRRYREKNTTDGIWSTRRFYSSYSARNKAPSDTRKYCKGTATTFTRLQSVLSLQGFCKRYKPSTASKLCATSLDVEKHFLFPLPLLKFQRNIVQPALYFSVIIMKQKERHADEKYNYM